MSILFGDVYLKQIIRNLACKYLKNSDNENVMSVDQPCLEIVVQTSAMIRLYLYFCAQSEYLLIHTQVMVSYF